MVPNQKMHFIDGDLFVTGAIDGGNKGRLAGRFSTADGLKQSGLENFYDIEHPTKGKGWRLRYVCLRDQIIIAGSISVQLQPIGLF